MKYNFLVIGFFSLVAMPAVMSQEVAQHRFFAGAYYSFLRDPIVQDGTFDTVYYNHQYLDLNFRFALNRVWRVGVEYNLGFVSFEDAENPFSTTGATLDYDILRARRSKLNLRAGISFSNLSFAGDGPPHKQFVVNRVLGGSYEYRISEVFWINGGFYHHYPWTKVPDKYAMIQPFVGVSVGW